MPDLRSPTGGAGRPRLRTAGAGMRSPRGDDDRGSARRDTGAPGREGEPARDSDLAGPTEAEGPRGDAAGSPAASAGRATEVDLVPGEPLPRHLHTVAVTPMSGAAQAVSDNGDREQESTAESRSRTTALRFAAAARRDELAEIRDRAAAARDEIADARDTRAAVGDMTCEARAEGAHEAAAVDDVVAVVGKLTASGASNRRQSALERVSAANDRDASGDDRSHAADDRRYSGLDELTGVFRRGTGELALTAEIDRARRSGSSLVIAIIDIDELKALNDNHGHAAGDALLRDVPTAITSTLRSYDVTVRWGGDEFVYALSEASLEEASSRAAEIEAALKARRPGASISTGLARLEDDDTLESLIARADTALRSAKVARKP